MDASTPPTPVTPAPPASLRRIRYRRIFIATVLISVLLVLLAGGAWYLDYHRFLAQPLHVPASGHVIVIAPGTSWKALATHLVHRGIARSALYLRLYVRLRGMDRRMKAGEYHLVAGTTPPQWVDQVVHGRVMQHTLTIVEGWTFKQLRQALQAHPKIAQTLMAASDQEVMARLNAKEVHPEGRFFPDTYRFPAGTHDITLLKQAFTAMENQLQRAWSQRDATIPLQTPQQALILASIIEKETGIASERRHVAGVFTRRLQKGMLLQADPTVIYGLGDDFNGTLNQSHLRTDTPYNTYLRKGLPPTPIALPSAASLEAAVNPAPGEALYFVADGRGGHVFSKTLAEHHSAVRQYYQLRRAASDDLTPLPPTGKERKGSRN